MPPALDDPEAWRIERGSALVEHLEPRLRTMMPVQSVAPAPIWEPQR